MKSRELKNVGIPKGPAMKAAFAALKLLSQSNLAQPYDELFAEVVQSPKRYLNHPILAKLAELLAEAPLKEQRAVGRATPAPMQIWGEDFEPEAINQLTRACHLPVSVRGALMPDAHVGYGLPIGGVLATENAVIPYAVGVDIACRMKMTILDLPLSALSTELARLKQVLNRETSFGVGAEFSRRKHHRVMDRKWNNSPVTKKLKDKAWAQLGTSGSGNHFVEFGVLTVLEDQFLLKPGTYFALLSHSGSRGVGNEVATYYSKIARTTNPTLPRESAHLAWLDLDSQIGQEYWQAMTLMGHYAAANHECIHSAIHHALGAEVLLDLENHHNFAWKERYNGSDVIVHRKGATPAATGVYGIIPGSMATPGYVVRGLGNEDSLNSASHGAGRKMSRQAAKRCFSWQEAQHYLEKQGVTVISAGLDEVPMAYKDIDAVMEAQSDLVETVARFDPKIVKMAK